MRRQRQGALGGWRGEVAAAGIQKQLGQQQECREQMDRGFATQRNQGWLGGSSGTTGYAQHMRAEIQEKEGMGSTGAEEARESAGCRRQQG